jgi:ribosomal protein L32
MKIDLRSILHGEREFQFQVKPDWWEENCRDDSVIGLAAPLKVTIQVSSAGNKYILDGRMHGEVILRCDRCLESYKHHLVAGFRIVLVVRNGENGQTEVELFQEDLEEGFVADLVIDLAEVTREQVFLALPMKSVCREDCTGLCPVCGTNLNRETCECRPVVGHPGFSRLKELGTLPDRHSSPQARKQGSVKKKQKRPTLSCVYDISFEKEQQTIMALPKKRKSKAKRDSRRAHDRANLPRLSTCPQCHEPVLPHHVCPECGSYRGRTILKTEEE